MPEWSSAGRIAAAPHRGDRSLPDRRGAQPGHSFWRPAPQSLVESRRFERTAFRSPCRYPRFRRSDPYPSTRSRSRPPHGRPPESRRLASPAVALPLRADKASPARGLRRRSSSWPARWRRHSPRSSAPRGRRGSSAHCARYIVQEIFLGMRVALKIAYDGSAFFGHQRQPDRRTVEGECLAALRAGKILRNPRESFFRSASRTDRGVSAVGNVIAFDAALRGDAVVGVFNDHAEGVWAWAYSEVPPAFHPRHAVECWYRYHLYDELSVDSLQEVGALFLGDRDFRSFTSEPPAGPFALNSLDVTRDADVIVVARSDSALDAVQAALEGKRHDFGVAPAEPLFLMDVSYGFPFQVVRKGKALDEWHALRIDAALRVRWLRAIDLAASA